MCFFIRVLFLSDPARTKQSDSERLDQVTTTASSSFSSVTKASVKRNKGLRRLALFKRTVRIGHPHTRNPTNFQFPTNPMRGIQKDRYDWSPSHVTPPTFGFQPIRSVVLKRTLTIGYTRCLARSLGSIKARGRLGMSYQFQQFIPSGKMDNQPTEILEETFRNLSFQDMLSCMNVCLSLIHI